MNPTDGMDITVIGTEPRPWFMARYTEGRVKVAGQPTCLLGVRLSVSRLGMHDGIFAEWHWDGQRLTVTNDRYGIYPLFYRVSGSEIWISPSLSQVLAEDPDRRLDHRALSVFLRMGHFVGDDTPFESVRTLPPASTLTWAEGRVQITSGTSRLTGSVHQPVSFEAAADQYAQLMEQALAKRLPENGESFTVPVSGGRDSRHLLLALNKLGHKPTVCPTVRYRPPSTNEDARVGAMLCDALGIEHIQLPKAQSWFDALVRDTHLTEFCGGGHTWILPLAAYLKGKVTTTYDGLAGDVLSGGFMVDERKLDLFARRDFGQLASIILGEAGREGYNQRVLSHSFREKTSFDVAIERLIPELEHHAEAENPVLSFNFWNRTRRGISSIPFSILCDVPKVHCPYLDHDVFDFLAQLDPTTFLGNRFHDQAIQRAYPEYDHIPYENKSAKARLDPGDEKYYRSSLYQLLASVVRHGLVRQQPIRPGYVVSRTIYDVLSQSKRLPWYMNTTVYLMELERQCTGNPN